VSDAKTELQASRLRRSGSSAVRRVVWLVLALTLLGGAQIVPPDGQQPGSGRGNLHPQDPFGGTGAMDPAMVAKQTRALNEERQKSMVSDTEKLVKLARELTKEVDPANPDSFTPAQLQKVAEIEKLARNVKQKMGFAVSGGPGFREIFP